METGPDSGAVQVHQTDRPSGRPAWSGSSGSLVAPKNVAVKSATTPWRERRLAKSSFDGGGDQTKLRTKPPPGWMLLSIAIWYVTSATTRKYSVRLVDVATTPVSASKDVPV